MSWTDWASPIAAGTQAPVTLTATKAGARFRQRLSVTVRPRLLDAFGDWWAVGGSVRVMMGASDHAGMIRIIPAGKGGLPLSQVGKKTEGRIAAPTLTLFGFPGLPTAGHARSGVDYEYNHDWIEIVLPDWITRPAAAPASAVKPPFHGALASQGVVQRKPVAVSA